MKRRWINRISKKLFVVLASSVFLVSYTVNEDEITPGLTAYNESVVDYFKEVALGFEFSNESKITRRWEGNMKLFIGGKPTPALLAETNRIVGEINDLATNEFNVEVVSDSLQSNFYIFFGSGNSYAAIFPAQSSFVASNWGLFSVSYPSSGVLFKGHMYVDINRANLIEQKHLLREELTQSLGLARDSDLYPESIFQQSFSTKTTEYAPIDKDLIRLLYHPKMKVGLDRDQVDKLLRDILLAEQPKPLILRIES
jgi:hypothetical protein